MESIVLHSDVARLVLGYLVNQNLKRAAHTLCRTSPHLQEEFLALKQGLQTHNFLNGGLEEIICEHVKITGLVASAVQKLPLEARLQYQQLKLSERVNELIGTVEKSSCTNDSSNQGEPSISLSQRKRRLRTHSPINSLTPSFSKRPRLLPPHLYCSINREKLKLSFGASQEDQADDLEEEDEGSTTATDDLEEEELTPVNGPGPRNNSTPRQGHDELNPLVLTPQSMPELASAIIKNQDFQATLVKNINVALQTVTVNNPAVSCDAMLDGLVKNILEATEKDPSFDRIIQEVVIGDPPPDEAVPGVSNAMAAPTVAVIPAVAGQVPPAELPVDPVPPQTPLIIRTAVAATTGTNADPNFSISKLIVLNSNESVQKMVAGIDTSNVSFTSDGLNLNFADPSSMLTEAEAAAGGQVCVDATTGQLTFPMYLSNGGLLSHFPFLVNNEWVAQQLGPDAFANVDDSHIEICLPEPITLSANQLPPNSIIINSAQKQPPAPSTEPPVQLIKENVKGEKAVKVSAPKEKLEEQLEEEQRKVPPASLDSSRQVMERVTPSAAGIINVKAFRSLSTPRKRTSHVRTLTFSPKVHAGGVLHPNTPLSTRRPGLLAKAKEKPIINHVEIIQPACDLSSTEGLGGVPPLFAMEECSNQTVIKAHPPAAAPAASLVATPKRKQKRQAAVKACKRIISQAESESKTDQDQDKNVPGNTSASSTSPSAHDDSAEASKENLQEEQKIERKTDGGCSSAREPVTENDMAAWQRQLHGSNSDLESRLREINSKREEVKLTGRSRRLKKKATPTSIATRVRKTPVVKAKVESKNQIKKALRSVGDSTEKINIKIITPQKPKALKKKKVLEVKEEIIEETLVEEIVEETIVEVNETDQQKVNDPEKAKAKDQDQMKALVAEQAPPNMAMLLDTPFKASPIGAGAGDAAGGATTSKQASGAGAAAIPPTPGMAIPPLDTPYGKLPSSSFLFGSDTKSIMDTPQLSAITPGFRLTPFGQIPGTPVGSAAKTEYSSGSSYYRPDEAEHTDANAQCAIQQWEDIHEKTQPKERFKDKGKKIITEKELPQKGDESPKEKRQPRQRKQSLYREEEHPEDNKKTPKRPDKQSEEHAQKEEIDVDEKEKLLEKTPAVVKQPVVLSLEPTVLRRVRSFGSEAVDSAESAAAGSFPSDHQQLPHYKLLPGLPEAIIEGSSSSSSSATSTSSSSSSSSSSSNSTSSSSSSSQSSHSERSNQGDAKDENVELECPKEDQVLLNIDNLSNISSTEDEEWLKAATGLLDNAAHPMLAIDSLPGQLVSQDGEVRYPIRNWLTPSKEQAQEANTSGESRTLPPLPAPMGARIGVAPPLPPLPPADPQPPPPPPPPPSPQFAPAPTVILQQENQRKKLDEKRQRVMAKFKEQSQPAKIQSKKTATKKFTAMRETAKLANPSIQKSPKKREHVEPLKTKGARKEIEPSVKVEATKSSDLSGAAPKDVPIDPPPSKLDPALLIALNLSAKKQEPLTTTDKPKVTRAAVEIAAQPAPGKRGRPKKALTGETTKICMRRSSRLIDNKTPAPEEPFKAIGDDQTKANDKSSTKKPVKKRVEARVPSSTTSASALPMVAEAESTQGSPEQQKGKTKTIPRPRSEPSSDFELDICLSSSQERCTLTHSYEDNGPKSSNPMMRQPASYFKSYQMQLMTEDDQVRTMRTTNFQMLNLNQQLASVIRNIPKKRIRRLTSNSGAIAMGGSASGTGTEVAAAGDQPSATSTPLVEKPPSKSDPQDEDDLEVAAINSTPKAATSSSGGGDEETPENPAQQKDSQNQNHSVEIEDIESILSHLHGT